MSQAGYYANGYYYYNPGVTDVSANYPVGALSSEGFPDTSGLPAGSLSPQGFVDASSGGSVSPAPFPNSPMFGLPTGSLSPQGFPSPVTTTPGFTGANFGQGLTAAALALTPTVGFQNRATGQGLSVGPGGIRRTQGVGSSLFSNPLVILGAIVLLAMMLKHRH